MRRYNPYLHAFMALTLCALQACGPSGTKQYEAPQNKGSEDYITTGTTGGTTQVANPESLTAEKITTPYTIAGSRDIFEKIAAELSSQTDQFLAFSVKDIRIVPLDGKSKVVRENPTQLQLQVDLKYMYPGAPTHLVFNMQLTTNGEGRVAKQVRQEKFADFETPFTANVKCFDEDCSLVEVRLERRAKEKNGSPGKILGQVGALFSLSYPTITVERPNDISDITNAQLKELERIARETVAIKSSVAIVNGPAFTRVTIPKPVDPKNPTAPTKNVLEIETELVDTGRFAPKVNKVVLDGTPTNSASALLSGNDPESGSLIVDISVDDLASPSSSNEKQEPPQVETQNEPEPEAEIPSPDEILEEEEEEEEARPKPKFSLETWRPSTPNHKIELPAPTIKMPPMPVLPPIESPTQTLRLIIQEPETRTKKGPQKPAPTPPMKREAPRAAVQIGKGLWATSAENKAGLDAASRFAGYASHPKVQSRVQSFVKTKSKYLTDLFSYAPLVSEPVEKIFEALDMTPEFAYILNIESNYLVTGQFNATQVTKAKPSKGNKNPSAFGPWQIINDTAFAVRRLTNLPFNVFQIKQKKWHPEDDRGYLAQATYMAALYLKRICEPYKHDPTICIFGYHGGEGTAKNAVNKTVLDSRISRFNVTFEMMAKFNMHLHSKISYVFDFLAYREIGQNPEKYNLHQIQPAQTDKYKIRLNRPGGPLPPGIKL